VVTGVSVDVCELQLSDSVVSGRMCVHMRVCVVVGRGGHRCECGCV